MNFRILFLFAVAIFAISCTGPVQNNSSTPTNRPDGSKKLKIGFAMDTLKEERWVRDRDAFEADFTPKVAGAWSLHCATSHLDLDFFVMFSSMVSISTCTPWA